MISVIILKWFVLSLTWAIFWTFRFAIIAAPINSKNVVIAFFPWIAAVVYLVVFWWG
jgi:hypothetical protein